MENKEVADKLIEYFSTQDVKIIYKLLANCMIDLHRVLIFEGLPEKEREMLKLRLIENDKALVSFIKKGPSGDLNLIYLDSWEEK